MDGSTLRSHTGTTGTKYGYGVGAIGDASGDGVPDYGIGGGFGAGGFVEARSGADGSVLYTLGPTANSAQLGFAWINTIGDVDGDGRPDFFAGDISDSGLQGRGYVVSGVDGSVIRTFDGTGSEVFGISRNGGQDVDGDSVPDIFIAGYHNSEGAPNGGKAYVYSGATGTLLRTMTSVIANETIGYDAVQLGDADGDGLVDYLLSGDIESATSRGVVYVVRGSALP
jgi:FG-GAP-like repeat